MSRFALALLLASLPLVVNPSALASERRMPPLVESSVMHNFVDQPELKRLIAAGAVIRLGVSFDESTPHSLFQLIVSISPGFDAAGRSFAELVKHQLRHSFQGIPVNLNGLIPVPPAGGNPHIAPITESDASSALKAFADFVATPGLRRLLASKEWDRISIDIDFVVPPPELQVGLIHFTGGIPVGDLETDIPANFEGYPVRVDFGGVNVYGTLKSRPGRGRKPNP